MFDAIVHNVGRQINAPFMIAGGSVIALALIISLWMRSSFRGYGRLQRINASERTFVRAAAALGVAFFVMYSYLSIHRYYKLLCGSWDLGIFDSLMQNALHGRFFLDYRGPFDHFQPILAFLLPLYALWQDPRLLLVVQAASVALAAWPLYLLAREVSGYRVMGAVVAMMYLLYPMLGAGTLYDYHGISLTPLFFFSMLLCMVRRRWGWYWVFMALMALTKESEVILSFGVGLYLLTRKEYRIGAITVAVSVAWFFLATKVFLPWTSGADYRHLARYAGIGDVARWAVASDRGIVTAAAFTAREIAILCLMMLPVGFLALRRWKLVALVFGPYFLVNVFSKTVYQNIFHGHYTLTVSAAVLGTTALAIDGLRGFSKDEDPSILPVFLVIVAALSNLLFSWPANERFASPVHYYVESGWNVLGAPLPVTKERLEFYRVNPHEEFFANIRDCFPKGATIAAQNNLGYFFSADYALKDLKEDVQADYYLLDLARVDAMHSSPEMLKALMARLDADPTVVRFIDLSAPGRPDFVFYAGADKWQAFYENAVKAHNRNRGNLSLVLAAGRIEQSMNLPRIVTNEFNSPGGGGAPRR